MSTSNATGLAMSYVYSGASYVIVASGGYSVSQGFAIARSPETLISRYDTTGSVEVLFDVRILNNLLGIQKDVSNINIISSGYYDGSTGKFIQNNDNVYLTASTFFGGINDNSSNIISVGQLSTIYADFSQYIASYFGFSSPSTTAMSRGFATLFSKDYNFNLNNGIFDAAEFVKIITGSTITSGGAYVADLSGSVNIIGVSNLLRNAVDANPFGNRDPSGGTTAGDPTRRNNYGVSDGFFENDLIFIPNLGITITLQLGIDAEAFPYTLNNKGPAYSNQTRITQDISGSFTVGVTNTSTFSQVTTTSSTLISRVITAPLLIRLANLSHSSITVPSITTTTTSVILNISGGYTYYTVSRGIQ